jgi:hypothetical protein
MADRTLAYPSGDAWTWLTRPASCSWLQKRTRRGTGTGTGTRSSEFMFKGFVAAPKHSPVKILPRDLRVYLGVETDPHPRGEFSRKTRQLGHATGIDAPGLFIRPRKVGVATWKKTLEHWLPKPPRGTVVRARQKESGWAYDMYPDSADSAS